MHHVIVDTTVCAIGCVDSGVDERTVYTVTLVICGHFTISVLWGNTAYCVKLSGEDLSRYLNKIESAGSKNLHIISILVRNGRRQSIKHFSGLAPHRGGKTVGTDVI